MKHLIFNKVIMENYGPFIDRMELNFLPGKFLFIFGPNGQGKSTMLNALPFAFWGITSKGERGDDMVNTTTGKNCYVAVNFNDETTGDIYDVERYCKYKSIGDTVIVKKNGVDIKKGQREVTPYLDELICPRNIFMNMLFFAQGFGGIFGNLVEVFWKILNIEKYKEFRDVAKKEGDEIKKSLDDIATLVNTNKTLIQTNEEFIESIKTQRIEFERKKVEDIENITTEIKTQKIKATHLKNEIENSKDLEKQVELKNLKDLNSKNSTILSEIENKIKNTRELMLSKKTIKESELKKQCDDSITEVKNKYTPKIEELKEEYEKVKNEFTENKKSIEFKVLEIDGNIRETKNLIQTEKLNLDEISNSQDFEGKSNCPYCGQLITEECIEQLNKKKELIDEKIINLQDSQKQFLISKKENEDLIFEIENNWKSLQNKFKSEKENIEGEANEEIGHLQDSLKLILDKLNIDAKNMLEKAIEEIRKDEEIITKQISENDNKIEELENQINTINNMKQLLSSILVTIDEKENNLKEKEKQEFDESQIEETNKKISTLKESIKSLTKEKKKYDKFLQIAEFWKKGFSPSGIPNYLLDHSIPYINEQMSYYLEILSQGRYTVSFDPLTKLKSGTMKDKLGINVLDNFNKTTKHVSLSGGQSRIIDIATILSIRDLQNNINNIKFNILLLDEILDSLDQPNRKATINLLRMILKNSDLCIPLISHTQLDFIEKEVDEILEL